ncbi:MAG: response regulator [Ignavibacteria bacterium]|nr:response regulator [Ignavibacteria bacterium]
MTRKTRILVVEDDPAIRDGLCDLLRGEDYEVTIAHRGREALKKSRGRQHDLALLDINLPDINGFEVLRQIRSRGDVFPVIIISARTEPVDRIVGLEAGADDYVIKPFNIHEVLARVRAHLRARNRRREGGVRAKATKEGRALKAIMFTDMQGFSRTMHEDETLAIDLLERHNAHINRVVRLYRGRIVEIIGDAFLITFASAVQAVRCALAVLRSFKEYNKSRRARERIHVRIGIHLGDVLEHKKGIRGDAVNIAARLQQIAEPDTIALSESVHDAVHGKMTVVLHRVGVRRVKNISTPITVYRIAGDTKGARS